MIRYFPYGAWIILSRSSQPSLAPALAVALLSCGSDQTKQWPSLPGEKPEGCERVPAYDIDDITADLAYLASPELGGRLPGSAGDVAARAFVAERFDCLGLMPLSGDDGFDQPFTSWACEETGNVIGMLPGTSSAEELIVISAHIDHLGRDRLGANDNASGVTALLAIAQDLVNRDVQPERTIVFAVFGSEETDFEGSEHFMRHPPADIDPDRIVYNLNMDMVGSYAASNTLYALGTFTDTAGRKAVAARRAAHPDIDVTLGDESDLSDNVSFCSRGIPYVFFWTEDGECYHRRCDTSTRVDYDALTEIAAIVGETSLDLANSDDDLLGAVRPNRDVCYAP